MLVQHGGRTFVLTWLEGAEYKTARSSLSHPLPRQSKGNTRIESRWQDYIPKIEACSTFKSQSLRQAGPVPDS